MRTKHLFVLNHIRNKGFLDVDADGIRTKNREYVPPPFGWGTEGRGGHNLGQWFTSS